MHQGLHAAASARLVATLALLAAAAWPGAAAAQARPDLTVSKLANPPLELQHAGSFTANDTVRNAGKTRAGASTTRYYLSRTKAKAGATRLGGVRAVKALAPGATSKGQKRLTLPKTLAPGLYSLVACADDLAKVRESNEKNNCRAAARRVEVLPPPTSHGLIEAARARGEISSETALTYTVFAEFGDSRLPARFRGAALREPDTDTLREVSRRWGLLSAATRTTLAPFLIPPFNPLSWHGQRAGLRSPLAAGAASPDDLCAATAPDLVGWGAKTAVGGKVKLWFQKGVPGQEAKAQSLATELDAGVWNEVTSFWREPLPDGAPGQTCRGGDDALDIALVDRATGGAAISYGGCVGPTPGFALIKRDLTGANLRALLVHELAHVAHYAYAADWCSSTDTAWLTEATATWTEDHVYRGANTEHQFAWDYLNRPALPLDTFEPVGGRKLARQYGAYLFFLFLALDKDPARVQDVWDELEGEPDVLTAVQTVLGRAGYAGGFREAWKRFALLLLNRAPVTQLKQWDGISVGVNLGLDLGAMMHAPDQRDLKMIGLPHLASDYQRFVFLDSVGEVVVKNPFHGAHGASVQAWVRLKNGQTRVDDLTDLPQKAYCRALADQNVEELVLVFANSGWDNRGQGLQAASEPRVETKLSCPLRGTASGTWVQNYYGNGQKTYTWNAVFDLERNLSSPPDEHWYDAVDGQLTFGMTGQLADCTFTVPMKAYDLSRPHGNGPRLFVYLSDSPVRRELKVESPVFLHPPDPTASAAPGTRTCNDGSFPILEFLPDSWTGRLPGTAATPFSGSRIYTGLDFPPHFTEQINWTWNVTRG